MHLVATGDEARALRVAQLGMIEARFPSPLPLDSRVARALGQLKPRSRAAGASRGDASRIWSRSRSSSQGKRYRPIDCW
jgi:hypothetical protein